MVCSSKPAFFGLKRHHYDTRNQWHLLWHLGFRLIHRIRLPEHLSYITRRRKTGSLTPRFLQLLRPGAVMCKMPCAVLEFENPLKFQGLNEVLVLVVFLFHFLILWFLWWAEGGKSYRHGWPEILLHLSPSKHVTPQQVRHGRNVALGRFFGGFFPRSNFSYRKFQRVWKLASPSPARH